MVSMRLERILGLSDGDLPRVTQRTLEAMSDIELVSTAKLITRVQNEMEAAADRGEWFVELELPRHPKLESGEDAPGFVPERVLVAVASLMGHVMEAPGTVHLGSTNSSSGADDLSWYLRLDWGVVEVDDYETTRRVTPLDLVLSLTPEGQITSAHFEDCGRGVIPGAWGAPVQVPGGLQQRMQLNVIVPPSRSSW